jgi:DNA modification methylase/ParB-like chromosome segregation protein Spo0J
MINPDSGKTKVIPISDIQVIDRRREEFGDIAALAQDILSTGLLQNLVLMETEDGTGVQLLAGERRLRALRKLVEDGHEMFQQVTCKVYPFMPDPIDQKTVELMENIARKDMSYAEKLALELDIHSLQIERFGEKVSNVQGHSVRDTAAMLEMSHTQLNRDLELAQAIKIDPSLGQLKNKTEALKALARAKEQMLVTELARRHQERKGDSDVDKARRVIANSYKVVKSSLDGLKQLEDYSLDFVEIDPAYNVPLRECVDLTEEEITNLLSEVIPADQYLNELEELFTTLTKKMRKNSWLILWHADEPWHQPTLDSLLKCGFEGTGSDGMWIKNRGNTRTPNIHFRNYYESFHYVRLGQAMLAKPGYKNIFNHNVPSDTKRCHPNEKPIELYMEILDAFCLPHHAVASVFAGSGNCLLAAANLGLQAVGWDKSDQYKPHYLNRVYADVPGEYSSY